ncbi:S-adenosyl-L-methionine-dependent methyltransferase [Mollisia scopiformis]|uniref:S-adenosyl-L-methionine-dependent methyltransferase n=1 Tax=Mollisia scopiformis TaxID=149040 RepID=A0A132B1H1_MOLSC|nr:S-adenosyl-L-methionine-dependent methyltransferase [Mollisia scopiformis]KUJ06232.1 S-adenosyl-L-methionine-dependent methyltransferase [Mollisia scopiformis]
MADLYNMSCQFHMVDVERLVQFACLKAGESVLDLCTGTGYVALEARKRVQDGRVAAIDFNPAMLDEARKGAEAAGFSGLIELIQGDVRDKEVLQRIKGPNCSGFDVITCLWGSGLTRSHEHVAMWAEFLAPNGRLVIDHPVSSDELGVLGFDDLSGNQLFSWEVADSDSWEVCKQELETLIHRVGLRMDRGERLYPERNRFGIDFIRSFSTEMWAQNGQSGQPDRSFTLEVARRIRDGMRNYWYDEPLRVHGRPKGIPRNKVVAWLAVLRKGN